MLESSCFPEGGPKSKLTLDFFRNVFESSTYQDFPPPWMNHMSHFPMVRLPGLRLRQVAGRGHGIEDWEALQLQSAGFGMRFLAVFFQLRSNLSSFFQFFAEPLQ